MIALDVLLPSEAARALGVSLTYVRRLVDTGRLPAQRAGGIRLLDRRAVEAMASERRKNDPSRGR